MLKRNITVAELIGFGIMGLTFIIAFYINTNTRISALEFQTNSSIKVMDRIDTKLENLNEGQNEIKIIIQNKQDRK